MSLTIMSSIGADLVAFPIGVALCAKANYSKDIVLGSLFSGCWTFILMALDGGRIGIASQAVGIAQGAINETVEYVKTRKQFGQALSAFQNTQFEWRRCRPIPTRPGFWPTAPRVLSASRIGLKGCLGEGVSFQIKSIPFIQAERARGGSRGLFRL